MKIKRSVIVTLSDDECAALHKLLKGIDAETLRGLNFTSDENKVIQELCHFLPEQD